MGLVYKSDTGDPPFLGQNDDVSSPFDPQSVEVLHPVGIKGHLQGENIQSYNLFSPVMMIT